MPFITQYYLDIKTIDGNAPVKRRVEFFRRSTNAHLLTVPAINVPNDGYLYITSLPTDIPAKDIIGFRNIDISNVKGELI